MLFIHFIVLSIQCFTEGHLARCGCKDQDLGLTQDMRVVSHNSVWFYFQLALTCPLESSFVVLCSFVGLIFAIFHPFNETPFIVIFFACSVSVHLGRICLTSFPKPPGVPAVWLLRGSSRYWRVLYSVGWEIVPRQSPSVWFILALGGSREILSQFKSSFRVKCSVRCCLFSYLRMGHRWSPIEALRIPRLV